MINAMYQMPKALAHAALSKMSAITPAFTDLLMFSPMGSSSALNKGVKIIR